jgi:hypothetical protein
MKKLLAALLMAIALPAHAVGTLTDASDLWWNANEAGWGINVIHQNDILFITFFVYSASRNPVWYSASEVRHVGGSGGAQVFSGTLYETNGPLFSDFFDPASVRYREVGSLIFRMNTPTSATLTYSIDGRTIQKQLTRFTWRVNPFAGNYLGALAGTASNCPLVNSNGLVEEGGLQMLVTQGTNTLSIRYTGTTTSCSLDGSYAQDGRLGASSGQYSCINNTFGTYDATEIEANPQAFSAKVTFRTNVCNFSGRIGGVRRGG